MKIVEAVHGFPPEVVGGTERYVQRITEGLRDQGHEMYVYAGSLEWMEDFTVEAMERDGYELTKVHRNDLYFDRWDKAYNPLVDENFREYLKARKPDLVHVHHWVRLTSNLCALSVQLGIPVVVTLHDLYATCPRFFRMKDDGSYCVQPLSPESCVHCAERWLFQRDPEIRSAVASFSADILDELTYATRVLTPSETHADTIRERLALKDLAIQVLPHGSLTDLEPAPRPGEGGKLKAVYFSHLYPFKGPRLLLEAYKLMERRDEMELHLFGGEVLPDFAKELKAFAQGMDVAFHGPYKPEDLSNFPMDLIVIPTLLAESYSFILDEAAALSVPVVASDSGALRERAGESVLLFRKGDAKGLASVLDRLAADRGELERMRAASPVRVLSMEEHLERLDAVYREAKVEGAKDFGEDRIFDRLKEQWERREFGFKELIRSEQWESLVASLRKRIVELESELVRRSDP